MEGLYGAGSFPGCNFRLGHKLKPALNWEALPMPCQLTLCTPMRLQGLFCAVTFVPNRGFCMRRHPMNVSVGVAAVSKQRAPFFPANRGSWCELNITCLQPLFCGTSLGAWHHTNAQQKNDGPSPAGLGGAASLCPTIVHSSSCIQECSEGDGCAG